MIRIYDLARNLDYSVKELTEQLIARGVPVDSANSKVSMTTEEVRRLLASDPQIVHVESDSAVRSYSLSQHKFQNDQSWHAKPVKLKVIDFEELPEAFNTSNSYADFHRKCIQQDFSFTKYEEHARDFGEVVFTTIFSDVEAAHLCAGQKEPSLRRIARAFINHVETNSDQLLQMHQMAMKLLERYGKERIHLAISLPPAPFKLFETKEIFDKLDIRRKKNVKPVFRILYSDGMGSQDKLRITFFEIPIIEGSRRYVNTFQVHSARSGQVLFYASRDGRVIPNRNVKEIIPVLQFFYSVSDWGEAILNYGLQTGDCSICGRELTDPESIKRGIGPVCGRL